MKIATMTWYHYENYGTALQAAALTEILREMGHEVQMIQYLPSGRFLSVFDYSLPSLFKRHFGKRKTTSKFLSPFVSDAKTERFQDFLRDHIHLTSLCETASDLEGLNDQFDAFVCGSDQIWSPLIFDPKYYLDFVHERRKKIAYAPSLGVKQWNDKFIKREIQALLSDFGSISIREEAGRQLIQGLTGADVPVVLDPTLLLTDKDWEQLCNLSREHTPAYVLAYFLGSNEEHWESVKKTADILGLPLRVIPVHKSDLQRDGCRIDTAVGPREFLELIKGASYVCTDSFHGLIFSILFHRPFTAYMRFAENDLRNQNTRVEHLINLVGMKDRLYHSHNESLILSAAYDSENANQRLAERRHSSIAFLEKALADVPSSQSLILHVMQQNSLCCGCGACSSVCPTEAIAIRMNQNGFLSANVNEQKCIHCGKCTTVCPFCGTVENQKATEASLYSFIHKDSSILSRSTSGGASFAIASLLLEDGYKVVGCVYNRKKNAAEHILVKTPEDLSAIQGSKYIQSDFSSALLDAKLLPTPIAFFGTPCQIAGAKRVFQGRDDVIYCDLVCHGIPSMLLFRKYLDFLRRTAGIRTEAMQMIFRYKPKGWRLIHLFASDGTKSYCKSQLEDPFFRGYERGICYNDACYECRWRGNSEADIRLADFWGPRFEDNQTGVSMIVCFTKKGRQVLDRLQQNGALLPEQPISDYLKYQSQTNPLKPVFYSSVMKHLRGKTKIETLIDRYVFPLENKGMDKKSHIRYLFRMLVFKD